MVQKNKSGMWIRQAKHSNHTKYNWLIQLFMALCAYIVLILNFTELTGFILLQDISVILCTGVLLCVFYALMIKFEKQNWFYPGVLVLLLVFVLIGKQALLEGVSLFWNKLGEQWTLGTGWAVPELEMSSLNEASKDALLYFSVFLGCMGALLCCLMTEGMGFILPALLLIGMILFDKDISFVYLLLTLAVSVILQLGSGWKKEKMPGASFVSWMICGIFAVGLFAVAYIPEVENWAGNMSKQMHQIAHEQRYETQFTTLPEGNFENYVESSSKEDDIKALTVTMQNPEAMYLRGFTGAIFEDNCWKPLDKDALVKNRDLLYWLNLNGFNPDAQFSAATSGIGLDTNSISIQNVGACSKYMYVPFGLQSGNFLNSKNINEDGVFANAERIYSFSSVSMKEDVISQALEYLQTAKDDRVVNYREAETAYRKFVENYYLQNPQEGIESLETQWKKISSRYGIVEQLTPQQAQECALLFLCKCFPEGESPAEISLPLEMAEGSSHQYATVAVMTLRHFGIPARYVEGYIITDDMIADVKAGETIEVYSNHASAWVEVYQDGLGWIPMNVTPGLGELTEEQNVPGNSQSSQEVEDFEISEGEELEETPDEKETSEPDGGFVTSILTAVKWSSIIILLLVILLIVFIIIRRKVVLKRRFKLFSMEDKNKAIGYIFADVATLMEKIGLNRKNGSMFALVNQTKERFGKEYANSLNEMIHLNAVALFSNHKLEDIQRQRMLEFRHQTLLRLETEVKWLKRFWMKWISCLY